MEPKTMYNAINNSPVSTIVNDISAADTTIEIEEANSKLPPAPNIATIGTGEDSELVLYTAIGTSAISGVTRGFNGTVAKGWLAGTSVYRAFTAYDHDAFKSNIEALQNDKANKVSDTKPGNFAALDESGNPTDSGKKAADFATATQGKAADDAKGEVADARGDYKSLKERLTSIENISIAHRYGILWDKSNAACTRLYDAVGMTANAYKGIYNENIVNDFDDRYPWSERRVVNVDLAEYRRIKADDGDIFNSIVAFDGDADFVLDGSNGFVGVYTPEFWVRQEETSECVEIIIADQELPGYIHIPATIGGRYFACSDGNGGITSRAGAVPLSANMEGTNYTIGKIHSMATAGGMTLDDVYTWAADTILLVVEFATINSQAAIGDGVTNVYRQNAADLPLTAGSGNSVVVPVDCANVAIPGAIIDFGTSAGHAQTARRAVTAVNAYSADSNYKEIVFDGDPVTYTTATIVQIHGLTNTEDAQVGSKSGYIGTNGKSHAYYRGRIAHANMFRYVLGAYRQGGTDHMWYAKDRERAAAYDALDTAEHIDSGYSLPYKEDGANFEGYIKTLGLVKKLPLFPFCTEVGGTSSNPVGDYCYHPAKMSGNTVALAGGSAPSGSGCGRFYAYWYYGSGVSSWGYAALPFLI